MIRSDLYCEDFGASSGYYSKNAREIPIRGIPASVGKVGDGEREGDYISLFFGEITDDRTLQLTEAVAEGLYLLSAPHISRPQRILVAALGNGDIICDSLGQRAAERIIVTGDTSRGGLPHTYAIKTGVPSSVGISSAKIVGTFSKLLCPDLVICIDSLAATLPERIFRVVQITDHGISPGSGVSSHTEPISRDSLGIPTLTVGIPTVVPTASLRGDILMTDARISTVINRAASAIAGGINLFFTTHCSTP